MDVHVTPAGELPGQHTLRLFHMGKPGYKHLCPSIAGTLSIMAC
ncbi:MAG: hypothetical protein ACJA13_004122 [Paraglaciecola sp.]|jgi:hypothetical protein